ncbi:hypothetical protein Tco_1262241 [Tanacetum coccineum]
MGKANLVWLCWQTKEGSSLVLCLWYVHGPLEKVGCLRGLVAPFLCHLTFPFPPPAVVLEVHRMKPPLRVVLALASFLGFGMVLLGKELKFEAWLELPKSSNLVQRLVNKLNLPPAQNLRHLDRLNSKSCKSIEWVEFPKSHGGSIDYEFETRASHVRIDLVVSLSNQSRASPSREKGKSKALPKCSELRDV